MTTSVNPRRRQWRFYETQGGNRPVRDFLDDLPASDATEIVAEMRDVARLGLEASRHASARGEAPFRLAAKRFHRSKRQVNIRTGIR